MRISDWSSDVCSSELAFVNTNHGHDFGIKHQDSFVKWEGDKGAIKATLGKNINFPKGEADHFEYFLSGEPQQGWVSADIPGAWYPDAFVATMADLQCAIETPGSPHVTSVKNAYDTMRLVEARSEEHTSELQSLMRISYAVFCLKKKNKNTKIQHN